MKQNQAATFKQMRKVNRIYIENMNQRLDSLHKKSTEIAISMISYVSKT